MDFGMHVPGAAMSSFIGWGNVKELALLPEQRSGYYVILPACWPPYECWQLLSVSLRPEDACYSSVIFEY